MDLHTWICNIVRLVVLKPLKSLVCTPVSLPTLYMEAAERAAPAATDELVELKLRLEKIGLPRVDELIALLRRFHLLTQGAIDACPVLQDMVSTMFESTPIGRMEGAGYFGTLKVCIPHVLPPPLPQPPHSFCRRVDVVCALDIAHSPLLSARLR